MENSTPISPEFQKQIRQISRRFTKRHGRGKPKNLNVIKGKPFPYRDKLSAAANDRED